MKERWSWSVLVPIAVSVIACRGEGEPKAPPEPVAREPVRASPPAPRAAAAAPVQHEDRDEDRDEDDDAALTRGPEACEPVMFEAEPGQHDRYRFERDDGRVGFKNAEGEVVIEPRFHFAYEFSEHGVAGVADDKGFAFIDPRGTVIARAHAYDNGPDYFVAGRARIIEGDRVGFIDEAGNVVIEPTYDFAGPFCRGLAPVCEGCRREPVGEHYEVVGGKWGLVDRSGAVVVPLEYDAVELTEDSIEVVKGKRTLQLDATGAVISPAEAGR